VLTALGWSWQKPERRAIERDEAAIARWTREAWPRIKKAAPGIPHAAGGGRLKMGEP